MSGEANVIRNRVASGPPVDGLRPGDRRAARHAAARAEILAAAWELARATGLAGLSMREIGAAVGMRAQSVYSYFASKDEIHDAMFGQGYEAFLAALDAPDDPGATGPHDPAGLLRRQARRFFDFCMSDPVRYQLMFQRTLPGFEPSPRTYALAVAALDRMAADLRAAGIDHPDALDMATALFTGLTSQQLANDPGGTRWQRLVDSAVDMLLATYAPHLLHVPAQSDTEEIP